MYIGILAMTLVVVTSCSASTDASITQAHIESPEQSPEQSPENQIPVLNTPSIIARPDSEQPSEEPDEQSDEKSENQLDEQHSKKENNLKTQDSGWITVSSDLLSVDIPDTWSYEFPDYGPPGQDILIHCEDGVITMYIGYILAGNPYEFIEKTPHTAFLFDSMDGGYMFEENDTIMWLNARWLTHGIILYNDGDSTIFTDNEEIIWRIVKSLRNYEQ